MDRENARRETAQDMVKGKPKCEKILEQAAAKIKTPNRTQEEERQVEGKRTERGGGGRGGKGEGKRRERRGEEEGKERGRGGKGEGKEMRGRGWEEGMINKEV